MTPETVDRRFEGLFAEDVIRAVTDGEFHLAALKPYDYTGELTEACCEAVREMRNQPFDGRVTCAKIMSRTMEILDAQDIKVPPGWLPVLKTLRADGGAAKIEKPQASPPFGYIAAEDVLIAASSALHFYEESLKPFADVLVETAKYKGVPQSFAEAVPFLDSAIDGNIPHDELGAMIAVRDEIQSRVSCPF
jgi:hypothetical protein